MSISSIPTIDSQLSDLEKNIENLPLHGEDGALVRVEMLFPSLANSPEEATDGIIQRTASIVNRVSKKLLAEQQGQDVFNRWQFTLQSNQPVWNRVCQYLDPQNIGQKPQSSQPPSLQNLPSDCVCHTASFLESTDQSNLAGTGSDIRKNLALVEQDNLDKTIQEWDSFCAQIEAFYSQSNECMKAPDLLNKIQAAWKRALATVAQPINAHNASEAYHLIRQRHRELQEYYTRVLACFYFHLQQTSCLQEGIEIIALLKNRKMKDLCIAALIPFYAHSLDLAEKWILQISNAEMQDRARAAMVSALCKCWHQHISIPDESIEQRFFIARSIVDHIQDHHIKSKTYADLIHFLVSNCSVAYDELLELFSRIETATQQDRARCDLITHLLRNQSDINKSLHIFDEIQDSGYRKQALEKIVYSIKPIENIIIIENICRILQKEEIFASLRPIFLSVIANHTNSLEILNFVLRRFESEDLFISETCDRCSFFKLWLIKVNINNKEQAWLVIQQAIQFIYRMHIRYGSNFSDDSPNNSVHDVMSTMVEKLIAIDHADDAKHFINKLCPEGSVIRQICYCILAKFFISKDDIELGEQIFQKENFTDRWVLTGFLHALFVKSPDRAEQCALATIDPQFGEIAWPAVRYIVTCYCERGEYEKARNLAEKIPEIPKNPNLRAMRLEALAEICTCSKAGEHH